MISYQFLGYLLRLGRAFLKRRVRAKLRILVKRLIRVIKKGGDAAVFCMSIHCGANKRRRLHQRQSGTSVGRK